MSNKHPQNWGRLKFDLAQLVLNNWEEVEEVFRKFGAPTNKALISSEKEHGEDVFYISISSVLEGTRTLRFNAIQLCEKMARLFGAHQFLRQSISADVVSQIEKGAEAAREIEFQIHNAINARHSITSTLAVDINESGSSMTNEESPQRNDSSSDNNASYTEPDEQTQIGGLGNVDEDEESTLPPSEEQLKQRRNRTSRRRPIEHPKKNDNVTEREIKKEPEEAKEVVENVAEVEQQPQNQLDETKNTDPNVVDENVADLTREQNDQTITQAPTPPDRSTVSPSTSVDNVDEDTSKSAETRFQQGQKKFVKFLTTVDYLDTSKHLTMIFKSEYTKVPERRKGMEPWLPVERQEKTITGLDWTLKPTKIKKKRTKDHEESEDVPDHSNVPSSSTQSGNNDSKNESLETVSTNQTDEDTSQNINPQLNIEIEQKLEETFTAKVLPIDEPTVGVDDTNDDLLQMENGQVDPEGDGNEQMQNAEVRSDENREGQMENKGVRSEEDDEERREEAQVRLEENREVQMENVEDRPKEDDDKPIVNVQVPPEDENVQIDNEQVNQAEEDMNERVVDANRNKTTTDNYQFVEDPFDLFFPNTEPTTGQEVFVDHLTALIMTPDEIEKFNSEYERTRPSCSRVKAELTLFGGTMQKLQSMYGYEEADLCMEKDDLKVCDLYEINAKISLLQRNGNYDQPWLNVFRVDPLAHFPESAHHITKEMTTKSLKDIYTTRYTEFFEDKVDMKHVEQTIKYIMDRQTYISFLRYPNNQMPKAIEFEIGGIQNNMFIYPGGGKVEIERNIQPSPKIFKRQNWKKFQVGQMVWVKFMKTWWPAVIIGFGQNFGFDEQPSKRQPKMGPKMLPHDEMLIHVRYLTNERSFSRYEAVEHFCTSFPIRFDPSQNTANYLSAVVFNIYQLQKRGYFEEYITPKIAAELVSKQWDFKYLPPYQQKRLFSPASVQGLPDPLVLIELRQRFAKSDEKNRAIMIYQPFAFNEKSFKKTETGKREIAAARNIDYNFFNNYLLSRKKTLNESPIIYNPSGYIAKIFKQFKVWQDDEEEPSPKKPKIQ